MKLIIVESPKKGKTIEKYIQDKLVKFGNEKIFVLATKGHVKNILSKPGAVIKDQVVFLQWENRNPEVIKKIVDLGSKCSAVYIGTDLDREGETMGWHVAHEIFDQNPEMKIFRIRFNAVTPKSIVESLQNAEVLTRDIDYPQDSNNSLVKACLCRYGIDHSYGFYVSGLLIKKLKQGSISMGRVKGPTLGIVFERELEIRKFIPQEYGTISIKSKVGNEVINLIIQKINKKKFKQDEKKTIEDIEQINKELLSAFNSEKFTFLKLEKKEFKKSPPVPFITSSLQQTAHSNLGFSIKKTMDVCKTLYEGVDMEGETLGLITYIRTDSTYIDPAVQKEIKDYIENNFTKDFLGTTTKKHEVKNSQEAHEAIRPSDIRITPEQIKNRVEKDYFLLYDLIWRRTVASFMADSITLTKNFIFSSENGDHELLYRETSMGFLGYRKIYGEQSEETCNLGSSFVEKKTHLESLETKIEKKYTEAPGRLSEASIVKKMEEEGIGRPSTFVPMVESLFQYGFCEKRGSSVFILPKGVFVFIFMKCFFQKYSSANFTSSMEQLLDKVIDKEVEWKKIIQDFFGGLTQEAKPVEEQEGALLIQKIKKDFLDFYNIENVCPKCKNEINLVSFGDLFLGCSQYPNCNFSQSIIECIEKPLKTDKCQIKHSKFGWYVESKNKDEILRASIPEVLNPMALTEEDALKLLKLPIEVGVYKEHKIMLNKTKLGFFFDWNEKKYKINNNNLWNNCSFDEAVHIIEMYEQHAEQKPQFKYAYRNQKISRKRKSS